MWDGTSAHFGEAVQSDRDLRNQRYADTLRQHTLRELLSSFWDGPR